ncbi:neuronal acetylcholine receptor subunit alpha-2-like isoform X3 [Montipora foliosa]|uniref:neuronal acetylcholine receptor subunit alpha-2-like isoform X3 n=1 Tax=Montipora foliosa TaxID=591990 RepID=UPI0035F21524
MYLAAIFQAIGIMVRLVFLITALCGRANCFRERELVEKLLENYHTGLRPIIGNSSQPTRVNISIKLVQIFEMDVKKQVVITSVWLKQAWFDPALQWNQSKHGWIEEISLSPDDVWVPDTVLLNNAETNKMGKPVGMKNPLLVTSHGTVRWLAPVILKSSCKLNVRYFPFDEQFCRLKFASWTYSRSTIQLQPEETDILQNYTESGEWNLESVYALTSSSRATHIHTEGKSAVTYYVATIIEISCALILTCWVLRFHHYNTSVGKVPSWVKVYILGYVAKVVRYEVPDENTAPTERIEDEEDRNATGNADATESSLTRRRLPKEPSGITMMAKQVLRKQEKDNIQEEWQLAARVVNRLFLICYLIAVALSIFGIFLDVPGVLVSRPLPPTTDDE